MELSKKFSLSSRHLNTVMERVRGTHEGKSYEAEKTASAKPLKQE